MYAIKYHRLVIADTHHDLPPPVETTCPPCLIGKEGGRRAMLLQQHAQSKASQIAQQTYKKSTLKGKGDPLKPP